MIPAVSRFWWKVLAFFKNRNSLKKNKKIAWYKLINCADFCHFKMLSFHSRSVKINFKVQQSLCDGVYHVGDIWDNYWLDLISVCRVFVHCFKHCQVLWWYQLRSRSQSFHIYQHNSTVQPLNSWGTQIYIYQIKTYVT